MISQSNKSIEQAWRNRLLDVLSHVFNQLCLRNDPLSSNNTRPCSNFYSSTPCPLKIKPFLTRIANYSGCSNESLVLSLIYIDRLTVNNDKYMMTSHSFQRLVMTSILIAVKFYDDVFYKNSFYGIVGGVSCKELNMLEMRFLFEIKFDLFVRKRLYTRYHNCLQNAILDEPLSTLKSSEKITDRARPIQAFGRKLVSYNRSCKIREGHYYVHTKPIPIPGSSKPGSHDIHHQKGSNRDTRTKSYLAGMPVRCIGTQLLRNWQVTKRPLIGSA